MTLFPSFTVHEVKPVTKGIRYSLVGWVVGEKLK
jgi:predicted 2-oxoglutarate/Fe(II)-dependent dioxygenase YbiX